MTVSTQSDTEMVFSGVTREGWTPTGRLINMELSDVEVSTYFWPHSVQSCTVMLSWEQLSVCKVNSAVIYLQLTWIRSHFSLQRPPRRPRCFLGGRRRLSLRGARPCRRCAAGSRMSRAWLCHRMDPGRVLSHHHSHTHLMATPPRTHWPQTCWGNWQVQLCVCVCVCVFMYCATFGQFISNERYLKKYLVHLDHF